jgi:TPR repeat protein
MKQDPGGTSVENKTEYPHASFPAVDAGPANADITPSVENPQPRWKTLTILLHVTAAIPISILILFHQHKAVLVSGLIAAFPALFMLTVNKTITKRTAHTESFWKQPYTIFLIGFIAIAIGVVLVEGLPTYQDAKRFYAAVDSIQEQIDSGNKAAVRELAYLYLNKNSPIPHPYTHLTLDTKGAALLEEWVTSKMQAGEGNQYAEDMYNLAKSVAWYDKEKARKWFVNAHRHGHEATMPQLQKFQSDDDALNDLKVLAEREMELESGEQIGNVTMLSHRDEDGDANQSLGNRADNDLAELRDNLELYEPEKLVMGNTRDGSFGSVQPNNTKTSFGPQYRENLHRFTVRDAVLESYRIPAKMDAADRRLDLTRTSSRKQTERWDASEAAKWYQNAAEQGDANAQSNLGWLYFKGQGVSQSNKEAVKWYRKAAEQGDAAAQSNLGWMYETGKGVPQDAENAVKWYREAAKQGYAAAQSNLGAMYGNGKGIAHNDVLAYKWFDLAANQGYRQGEENRRRIAVKMTRWQIGEAQRLAREWMETHKK